MMVDSAPEVDFRCVFDVVEWKSVHRCASVALPEIEIWTVFLRAPCILQFVFFVQVLLKSSFSCV